MCDDYGDNEHDRLALPQGREASLHEGHPETSPHDLRTVSVPEPVEEPQARTRQCAETPVLHHFLLV